MMSVRLMFVFIAALTDGRGKQKGRKQICNFIAKTRNMNSGHIKESCRAAVASWK
jgi:hypothetical protein